MILISRCYNTVVLTIHVFVLSTKDLDSIRFKDWEGIVLILMRIGFDQLSCTAYTKLASIIDGLKHLLVNVTKQRIVGQLDIR